MATYASIQLLLDNLHIGLNPLAIHSPEVLPEEMLHYNLPILGTALREAEELKILLLESWDSVADTLRQDGLEAWTVRGV